MASPRPNPARAGGLRLAWPRASAPRLARDGGFIAHSPSARSLRMRAGTPAHPGCTWFTHAAHMLPIALSGENARSPAGASTRSGRASARTRNVAPAQAGFALPGRRPALLSAISYRLSAITYRLSAITYRLSAIIYRLSAIIYRLSAITYRLSAITYRLSAITYRLSPIGYHLSPI
jgi:hypothetical protein